MILLVMVLLIHRSPGCTEELPVGFFCPRDVECGHRRIKRLGVGGSAGHSVREELKNFLSRIH